MYSIFGVENETYNKKKATSLVLKIQTLEKVVSRYEKKLISLPKDITKKSIEYRRRRRVNSSKASRYKLELFNLMSKVVVKNINNYISLAFNSPVTEKCLSREEMQGEAWLIFEKCTTKFKADSTYCFYFYFNKSLSRNFYRMFFNTVQGKEKGEKFSDEKKRISSISVISPNYDMDFLLNQLNLDEKELRIIRSKLINEKKIDFLTNNPDFSSGKYYSVLKKVKVTILKLKENGEL